MAELIHDLMLILFTFWIVYKVFIKNDNKYD